MTSPKLSTLLDWNHPRWHQNVSAREKYYEATTSDFTHKRNIHISTPSLRIPACLHCCAEKYRRSLSPNPASVSPLVIFAYCTTWNVQPLCHETFLISPHPGLTMAFSNALIINAGHVCSTVYNDCGHPLCQEFSSFSLFSSLLERWLKYRSLGPTPTSSDSRDLGRGLKMCISDKFPGRGCPCCCLWYHTLWELLPCFVLGWLLEGKPNGCFRIEPRCC